MANVLSGNYLDALLIHTLNKKDEVLVGPIDWTNTGVTFETTNARFGENMFSEATGVELKSDSAVAGFDDSDGKNVLMHCFITIPDTTGVKTMGGITNSTQSLNRTRLFFFSNRIHIEWNRKTDLGVGLPTVRVSGSSGCVPINQSHSLVGFVDSATLSQGKIFVDGIDKTDAVTNMSVASPAGVLGHALLGNHTVGLSTDQYVDHYTLIQSDSLTDAKVAILAPLYSEVRSFGYRPAIFSLSVHPNDPTQIVINGAGFGPDATVTFDGVAGTNVKVFGDGTISVAPPVTASGLSTIAVTNVAPDVTVTESTLAIPAGGPPSNPSDPTQATNSQFPPLQGLGPIPLSAAGLPPTIWTENGLSNRRIMAGDNLTPEMGLRANDPLPVYHPRVKHTAWTQTQPVDPAL